MPKQKNIKKSQIIYKNIDFCKFKIDNKTFDYLLSKSPHTYNRETFQDCDMNSFSGLCLFGVYYIVNFGKIGDSKYRFDIRDIDKNKYGNIIFAIKEYKSNISYLELSGLFFKTNDVQVDENIEKLPYLLRFLNLQNFFDFFSISTVEQKILKNIQFCIDIGGREAFQIINMLKSDTDYKKVPVKNLTAFDYKKLLEKKGVIQYGKIKTGLTIPGSYNKLIIYDKILDILQNYLGRQINGKNPYQSYIDSEIPITRIELEKKASSFQHISDNSIDFIFGNIESLFFDYLPRYFIPDFRKISLVHIETLNGKSNHFAKRQKEIKLLHSLSMFRAYGKNLEIFLGKGGFEKELLSLFPDIQNKNILDYFSPSDTDEFLDKITRPDNYDFTSYFY